MESFVQGTCTILFFLLIPSSFVGAFFLGRKWIKDTLGRVFFTLIVGAIILVAGTFAIVAGCSSAYPMNFH